MRKAIIAALGLFSILALTLTSVPAAAALCFNCGSGSSNGCKQCRARGGKDTQKARKYCQSIGCKIVGYSSCSTASNVKVCRAPSKDTTVRASVRQSSRYFIY